MITGEKSEVRSNRIELRFNRQVFQRHWKLFAGIFAFYLLLWGSLQVYRHRIASLSVVTRIPFRLDSPEQYNYLLSIEGKLSVLREAAVLRRAARLLAGEENFLHESFKAQATRQSLDAARQMLLVEHGSRAALKEYCITRIQNYGDLRFEKRSSSLFFTLTGNSLEEAKALNWAWVEAARLELRSIDLSSFENEAQYYSAKLPQLESEQEQMQQQLLYKKRLLDLESLERDEHVLSLHIQSCLAAESQVNSDIAAHEKLSDQLRLQLNAQASPFPPQQPIQDSESLRQTRAKITQLEDQLDDLLETYESSHSIIAKHYKQIEYWEEHLRQQSYSIRVERAASLSDEVEQQHLVHAMLSELASSIRQRKSVLESERDVVEHKRSKLIPLKEEIASHKSGIQNFQVQLDRARNKIAAYIDPLHLEGLHFEPNGILPWGSFPSGALFALTLAVVSCLLMLLKLEGRAKHIRTEADLVACDAPPLLVKVPLVAGGALLNSPHSPSSHLLAEKYNSLATILEHQRRRHQLKSLLVSSILPGEGKSSCAANLAMALARKGSRVLLVDADLRQPKQHENFSMLASEGLGEFLIEQSQQQICTTLVGEIEISNAIRSRLYPSGEPGLSIMQAGEQQMGSYFCGHMNSFAQLLNKLEESFDCILIDSPPVSLVADALELSQLVDATLMVVADNCIAPVDFKNNSQLITDLGGRFLGVVINKGQYVEASETPPHPRSLNSPAAGTVFRQQTLLRDEDPPTELIHIGHDPDEEEEAQSLPTESFS